MSEDCFLIYTSTFGLSSGIQIDWSINWFIDRRKIDDSIIHALNVSTPTASIQARGVDPKGRTFNIDFIWFHHGFKMFRWTWKFPKFLWCQILKLANILYEKIGVFFLHFYVFISLLSLSFLFLIEHIWFLDKYNVD